MINNKINSFVDAISRAIDDSIFVKLSLGNYKGEEDQLKKIYVKMILVKRQEVLSFTYHYKTRDIVKNYPVAEGLQKIKDNLLTGFFTATLSTTKNLLTFERFADKALLKESAPVVTEPVSLNHDKNKKKLISSQGKHYLHDLKITDEAGNVYKTAQDKFRQINRYIEILDPLIRAIPEKKELHVADMGSGKGYLTFALYDHLTHNLKLSSHITGVEYRSDMVDLCNEIASNSQFENLKFIQSGIEQYNNPDIDVLIALHACDTATDDAIYKGIKADADLIVVAPCCHKQIRRQIENSKIKNDLDFLTQHGIFMERHAEMVTDGIRALILQYFGYTTKVFEFISGEHTAKNVMIVASKNPKARRLDPALQQKIKESKLYFGIGEHYLEKLLDI